MGDQEKSGGSVSLTPQVEDVMKRICSNSKVKFNTEVSVIFSVSFFNHIDFKIFFLAKVDGVVVVNNEGIPIKSTLDSTSTVQVRSSLFQF